MALAKITGTGLTWIAVLVVVLWACILGEHLIVQRANQEFTQTMLEIRRLQVRKGAQPASTPIMQHLTRPTIS